MTLRGKEGREAARAMPGFLSGWWMANLITEVRCRMRSGFWRACEGFISGQKEDWIQGPRAQGSSLSSR